MEENERNEGFRYFTESSYKKNAATTTLLRWLKQGYTVEQIKKAADEVNVRIQDGQLRDALAMYEEWKKENPGKVTVPYKHTNKKDNKDDEER